MSFDGLLLSVVGTKIQKTKVTTQDFTVEWGIGADEEIFDAWANQIGSFEPSPDDY